MVFLLQWIVSGWGVLSGGIGNGRQRIIPLLKGSPFVCLDPSVAVRGIEKGYPAKSEERDRLSIGDRTRIEYDNLPVPFHER